MSPKLINFHNIAMMKYSRLSEVDTAHFVLLRPNYTMKKTCLSCDNSNFDEFYAHRINSLGLGIGGTVVEN